MKRIWSKCIATASCLGILLGLVTSIPISASASDSEYWFGNSSLNSLSMQGQQNWYAVYSNDYNQASTFNTNTFRRCEYANSGGSQMVWQPEAAEGVTSSTPVYYFGIRPDGFVGPAYQYTAGVQWIAPESGEYDITVQYSGGSTNPAGDGVIFGVYFEQKQLHVDNVSTTVSTQTYTVTLNMVQGQSLYLVADPKENPNYDSPWFQAHVKRMGNVSYTHGNNADPMTFAGENGFTAIYSTSVNQGASMNTGSFMDCEVRTSAAWIPQAGNGVPASNPLYYFAIRPDGLTAPCTGYSAGLRWTAPESGEYTVNISYAGGSSGGGDGVGFGIYLNTTNLTYNNVSTSISWTSYTHTLALKKGDSLYMIADPKSNGNYDSPWFQASIVWQGRLNYQYGQNLNSLQSLGQDGFTPVYSTSTNQLAGFNTATFTDCEYSETYGAGKLWKPAAAAGVTSSNPLYYFAVRPDGLVAPATGYTAGLRWQAPESGTYLLDANYSGGSCDPSGDGVIFGFYKGTEKLHSENTSSSVSNTNYTATVTLVKGQNLYFIVDPKTNANYDSPWMDVTITLQGNVQTQKTYIRTYAAPSSFPQTGLICSVKANGLSTGVYSDTNGWGNNVNFAYFDFAPDTIAEVEVTTNFSFSTYEILPKSAGVQSVRSGNAIRFVTEEANTYYTIVFDGNYQGKAIHIFANALDFSAPTKSYGNTIYFGAGYHDLYNTSCNGQLNVPSDSTVYIDGGAVVLGTIAVSGVSNVKIDGRGILMMTGNNTVNSYLNMPLAITYASNISVNGIITHSHRNPGWTNSANQTSHLTVTNFKAISTRYASTDGFDLSNVNNVAFNNVFIRSCDDSISIKGLGSGSTPSDCSPNEDITMENLQLWNDCNNAIVLGEETMASYYEDITFRNVEILYSYDDRDHHTTLNERAALSIVCLHGTYFRNILFESITINRCERFVVMTFLTSFWFGSITGNQTYSGGIDGVTFHNIQVLTNSGSSIANQILLNGWSSSKKIQNITFSDVYVQGTKLASSNPLINKNNYVDMLSFN